MIAKLIILFASLITAGVYAWESFFLKNSSGAHPINFLMTKEVVGPIHNRFLLFSQSLFASSLIFFCFLDLIIQTHWGCVWLQGSGEVRKVISHCFCLFESQMKNGKTSYLFLFFLLHLLFTLLFSHFQVLQLILWSCKFHL